MGPESLNVVRHDALRAVFPRQRTSFAFGTKSDLVASSTSSGANHPPGPWAYSICGMPFLLAAGLFRFGVIVRLSFLVMEECRENYPPGRSQLDKCFSQTFWKFGVSYC